MTGIHLGLALDRKAHINPYHPGTCANRPGAERGPMCFLELTFWHKTRVVLEALHTVDVTVTVAPLVEPPGCRGTLMQLLIKLFRDVVAIPGGVQDGPNMINRMMMLMTW